jgi:hypothetical protein
LVGQHNENDVESRSQGLQAQPNRRLLPCFWLRITHDRHRKSFNSGLDLCMMKARNNYHLIDTATAQGNEMTIDQGYALKTQHAFWYATHTRTLAGR